MSALSMLMLVLIAIVQADEVKVSQTKEGGMVISGITSSSQGTWVGTQANPLRISPGVGAKLQMKSSKAPYGPKLYTYQAPKTPLPGLNTLRFQTQNGNIRKIKVYKSTSQINVIT